MSVVSVILTILLCVVAILIGRILFVRFIRQFIHFQFPDSLFVSSIILLGDGYNRPKK